MGQRQKNETNEASSVGSSMEEYGTLIHSLNLLVCPSRVPIPLGTQGGGRSEK